MLPLDFLLVNQINLLLVSYLDRFLVRAGDFDIAFLLAIKNPQLCPLSKT